MIKLIFKITDLRLMNLEKSVNLILQSQNRMERLIGQVIKDQDNMK